jgi:hypothetical protein
VKISCSYESSSRSSKAAKAPAKERKIIFFKHIKKHQFYNWRFFFANFSLFIKFEANFLIA